MNRRRTVVATALAALALSHASGCSMVLVNAPSDPAPQEHWVTCTEYVLWPVMDIAYAALSASPIVFIAASDSDYRELGLILGTPLFLGAAALFSYSAFAGFSDTARCREVHRRYERGVASP